MSESNAIATINSMEGFQRLAQFSTSAAAKELAGFNMRFDRVKVPSGGGLTFMLQEPDANGNTDFREINAVILTHHPMQSYFQGKSAAMPVRNAAAWTAVSVLAHPEETARDAISISSALRRTTARPASASTGSIF